MGDIDKRINEVMTKLVAFSEANNITAFDMLSILPIITAEALSCHRNKKLSNADYWLEVLAESVLDSLKMQGWQDDLKRLVN